jgi:DNA-binding IclR family transcriptional regulator
LGKVEVMTPFRLVSEPGMRLPAHATAMGKRYWLFSRAMSIHHWNKKAELAKQEICEFARKLSRLN